MLHEDTIIKTERLRLREFSTEDAENFYYLNLDEEVMQYTGDLPFASIEASRDFIKAYPAYRESGYGRWTVELIGTREVIGWCGLKLHPDGMVDLGYRFHKKYWNNGYATEAAIACINYGFKTLKLEKIVGRTARANHASIRVLEKLKMQFWKEAPCEGIENSVYYHIFNI